MLTMLENGLFAVGQVLRAPVMTLLWVGIFAVLFTAGAALMEYVSRRREREGFDIKRWLHRGAVLQGDTARIDGLPAGLRGLLNDIQTAARETQLHDGAIENLLLEREERLRRDLDLPRALVKVGPSVGLLGTLIPMGTSLAALASGNLEAMAGQMVVAFTTTIIGLAIGTLAYVVTLVRQNWVNEAVREQRYLIERVAAELEAR